NRLLFVDSQSFHSSHKLLSIRLAAGPIAFVRLPDIFENYDGRRKQGGNRPPKAKAKFQNESRSASAFSNPFDRLPDIWGGGDAETPGHRAHDPEEASLGLALAQFLRAQ